MLVAFAPVFSVVIATQNAEGSLSRCLESFVTQQYRNFEVVIQDGASIDGTLATIEAYAKQLPFISIKSAEDSGLYDAWNKALPRCKGEWILFLGADDWLYAPDALFHLAAVTTCAGPSVSFIAAACIRVDARGVLFAKDEPGPESLAAMSQGMAVPHSALLHRRSLFASNRFDVSLKIAGDYDFVARTMTYENTVFCKQPLTVFSVGGMSGRLCNFWFREREFLRVSRKRYPRAPRWRAYSRLVRAFGFHILQLLLPEAWTVWLADAWRRLTGRKRLWTVTPPDLDKP